MSVINATPLLAAAGGDYQISRSVRLRSSASAYFVRSFGTAGSRTAWTWSAWVKLGQLNVTAILFMGGATNNDQTNILLTGDQIQFANNAGGVSNGYKLTNQVFRDPSAWYHLTLVWDSANATASDRMRMYVNGRRITAFSSSTDPSLNTNSGINRAEGHFHGRNSVSTIQYLDGYLTEVNFIDGQALTPSSFGETDSITGVWKPKKYAGTYGTNGFYLNFSDNSNNTAATIGKDYSGNGNNWTPNNISVTAGATYDSMLDVPTLYADGGNGRGNYAVLNPVQNPPSGAVSTAYSNANLTTTLDSSVARSTIGVSSGKWYAEFVTTSATLSTDTRFGVEPSDGNTFSGNAGQGRSYSANGNKVFNGSSTAYGSTWTTNDVIGCALDLDNGKVWWSKNGTWQASGDPAAGTNEAYSGLSGTFLFTIVNGNSAVSKTFNANFGQRPFAYTPPTGFKALNTQNLPEPTIKKGNQYFDATTYTGNGSTQSIVNAGGFKPDLVWAKSRGIVNVHQLFDSVRGVFKALYSNLTNAETNDTATLSSFNSNGFSLASSSGINTNADPLVAWQWKESPSAGFDIVTYTGTGANRTVSHSLGVKPSMIIVKGRSYAQNWVVYHSALGATKWLQLNGTTAALTETAIWNNTEPTSSVFTVGTSAALNPNGSTNVAYLFADVAGFSKFGSYTGNGSADGPFVFTGFRPRWVMIKRTDSTGNWQIIDTTRSAYNESVATLYPNLSNAEDLTNTKLDALANGYKIRGTPSTDFNTSGSTYIYAAFAESPFRNSLAR